MERERERERVAAKLEYKEERERIGIFLFLFFFCVWVLRVMVAVHVDRIEGVDGEDWVLWGRRGDFGFGWSGGLWLCTGSFKHLNVFGRKKTKM